MNNKPQTLKGFRDFLPAEKRQRDFVAEKIKQTFETFGFSPLETPTLEYASLLLGKYGEEADKLVYTFADKGDRIVGLRYDQTVPTARVLSQYQNDLPRYFRRYQMQNVFRADKPQKGRFREFTQCDVDIFGSTSPLADSELLAVVYRVFKNIGFSNVKIQINDRQTLINTLTPFATPEVSVFSIIQSIDKLDKQSEDSIAEELQTKGIPETAISRLFNSLKSIEKSVNLSEIEQYSVSLGVEPAALEFNPFLARGLDYYTGLIFEIRLPEYNVGSVGGGGRYDNLINDLTGLSMPAVGVGLGFDRIVEAAIEQNLIPENVNATQVLVSMFNEQTAAKALELANQLRINGVTTEVYPAFDNLGKQFKLADQKQIPWVIIIGEEEVTQEIATIKNMSTGSQQRVAIDSVVEYLCMEIDTTSSDSNEGCCGGGCC